MSPGIVAESDPLGTLKSEYVFFAGERVARKDFPSGAVSYYFSDHLKTASVVTDSAGTIKAESDYYPWGGELQFVNNDPNHYKFTGKERDSETGLDYFGARYYGNWLGRFITPDWAAKATAVPYAEFSDPQSLNLYSYVRNLPTSKADVDGHRDWPDWLKDLFGHASDQVSSAADNGVAIEERPAPAQLRTLREVEPKVVEAVSKSFEADRMVYETFAPPVVMSLANLATGDIKGAALSAGLGSVWRLGNFARGVVIERLLGANLPRNFPVIDKFLNGIATSIKSIDLTAKTYQNAEALASKINGYVDKLAEFKGADFAGKVIKASAITGRELRLGVPNGVATAAQQEVINAATTRAEKLGVKITVTEIQ